MFHSSTIHLREGRGEQRGRGGEGGEGREACEDQLVSLARVCVCTRARVYACVYECMIVCVCVCAYSLCDSLS